MDEKDIKDKQKRLKRDALLVVLVPDAIMLVILIIAILMRV